ncbi:hypothetical protein TNCV_4667681 [Trichonephila clavipes]|nr:hypothetical protein TNCV_4667681 [Trichonephila clavipes]
MMISYDDINYQPKDLEVLRYKLIVIKMAAHKNCHGTDVGSISEDQSRKSCRKKVYLTAVSSRKRWPVVERNFPKPLRNTERKLLNSAKIDKIELLEKMAKQNMKQSIRPFSCVTERFKAA